MSGLLGGVSVSVPNRKPGLTPGRNDTWNPNFSHLAARPCPSRQPFWCGIVDLARPRELKVDKDVPRL